MPPSTGSSSLFLRLEYLRRHTVDFAGLYRESTMPLTDSFSAHYAELLDGDYDCVDRLVLNGYFRFAQSAGGFRLWWRALMGSDDQLDNAHLMRLAGRFSRRVRAWAKSRGVPVIDCRKGERKHEVAAGHLPTDAKFSGVFCVIVGRAQASVWDVEHWPNGSPHLRRKQAFVNHYSFHIMDPEWGHVTIKLCGQVPFNAQIILNGHEYVARQADKQGIPFRQDGNCFSETSDARGLSRIADTLCEKSTVGRLRQLCERWIYTACACFALDLEDQRRTGFHYEYSMYQGEYSRNLLFARGGQMEQVVQWLIDRTRSALDLPTIRTLFGMKRPRWRQRRRRQRRFEVTVERPEYDLTLFKVHEGRLTLKVYTKGERVLRIEAMVHNTAVWGCRHSLEYYPELIERLRAMLGRFLEVLRTVDVSWVTDDTLERLPEPTQTGRSRVAGVNLNQRRMRAVLAGVLALSRQPGGFQAGELAERVRAILGLAYETRQAAYDLRKLRAKGLVERLAGSRHYQAPTEGVRAIAALITLREHVLKPLLAGAVHPRRGRPPKHRHMLDAHHERLQREMQELFKTLQIAA